MEANLTGVSMNAVSILPIPSFPHFQIQVRTDAATLEPVFVPCLFQSQIPKWESLSMSSTDAYIFHLPFCHSSVTRDGL